MVPYEIKEYVRERKRIALGEECDDFRRMKGPLFNMGSFISNKTIVFLSSSLQLYFKCLGSYTSNNTIVFTTSTK
jgi:hypothetical protein